jgi:hypothetical protein
VLPAATKTTTTKKTERRLLRRIALLDELVADPSDRRDVLRHLAFVADGLADVLDVGVYRAFVALVGRARLKIALTRATSSRGLKGLDT